MSHIAKSPAGKISQEARPFHAGNHPLMISRRVGWGGACTGPFGLERPSDSIPPHRAPLERPYPWWLSPRSFSCGPSRVQHLRPKRKDLFSHLFFVAVFQSSEPRPGLSLPGPGLSYWWLSNTIPGHDPATRYTLVRLSLMQLQEVFPLSSKHSLLNHLHQPTPAPIPLQFLLTTFNTP
eukprot:751959-Hanusia_phi.AAC.1